MPEIFAKKASTGHCHTEQEQENQNDSPKHCCSADSILPSTSSCISPDPDQEMLPEESLSAFKTLIAKNPLPLDLFLPGSSPPPVATILRI